MADIREDKTFAALFETLGLTRPFRKNLPTGVLYKKSTLRLSLINNQLLPTGKVQKLNQSDDKHNNLSDHLGLSDLNSADESDSYYDHKSQIPEHIRHMTLPI